MNATKHILTIAVVVFFLFAFSTNNAFAQKLYVMTTQGGNFSGICNNDVPQCGLGLITNYDCATGVITPEFDFTDSTGYIPDGFLMLASDGNLYGMNTIGGPDALSPNDSITSGGIGYGGTLFQYNYHTHTFTLLETLDPYSVPSGGLVEASDGNLYGLTNSDGLNGSGTLFRYNYHAHVFTIMQDLPDSSWPGGSLTVARDGNLYGLTSSNGANQSGTLFQYNYNTNTYTVKHDLPFNAFPDGAMIEASDSNLYGLTYADGTHNSGTLFQYNYRTNTYTQKKSLPTYARPYGGTVMEASDGNLYGLTYADGTNQSGTIFQYNYNTNFYTVMYNLPDSSWPWSSLMQASDSNIYGVTQFDGTNSAGTLFQFNYTTKTYTTKINFDGTNGAFPIYNRLVEVNDNPAGIEENRLESAVTIYPNPSTGNFTLSVNSPANEPADIMITNSVGQAVWEQKTNITTGANTIPLNLANRSNGIYFLSIAAGDGVTTKKIILAN